MLCSNPRGVTVARTQRRAKPHRRTGGGQGILPQRGSRVPSSPTEPPPRRGLGLRAARPASRPGPAPRPAPRVPEPHFSTSADFMMWVLDAVSFQGPKEKSWWLLWKPWIIMAEAAPVRASRNRLEQRRQRQRQRHGGHRFLRLRPAQPPRLPSRYHAQLLPAPPPAGRPGRGPSFRLHRPLDFCFRDQLLMLRDPRRTSRCTGKQKRGETAEGRVFGCRGCGQGRTAPPAGLFG